MSHLNPLSAALAFGLVAGPLAAQDAPDPLAAPDALSRLSDEILLDETLTPPTELDATNFVFLLPGVILALTAVVGASQGAGSTPNTVAEN